MVWRLWSHLLSWKNHILRFQTFVLFWKMPFIKITLVSLIFTSCWDTSDSMVIWSWRNEMHRGLFYLNCNLLGIYSAMQWFTFSELSDKIPISRQSFDWASTWVEMNITIGSRLVWLPQESRSVLSQSPFVQPAGGKLEHYCTKFLCSLDVRNDNDQCHRGPSIN